jgi:hypothetical protein
LLDAEQTFIYDFQRVSLTPSAGSSSFATDFAIAHYDVRQRRHTLSKTRFARHESFPMADCEFTDSGWFYKMRMKKTTTAKFYLVDGQGLTANSNNPGVVPNSDAVFTGKTGQEQKRTVEIYGLTPGVTLIGFTAAGSNDPVVTMQVEVVDLPGSRPSFVAFSAKSAALNAPDVAAFGRYQLDSTKLVSGGPPESLFDSVPSGTQHIAICCHGQMNFRGVDGITLFIGGNVTRGNCTDVFKSLKVTSDGGVIWIGGCEAGSDNDFCRKAVQASGCFLVAPMITLPTVHVPRGMIDYFAESKIKFFKRGSGDPMNAGEFLLQQKDLQFRIVSG